MGTFAHYYGLPHVPADKREFFAAQMMKILNYGGMMQFEQVSMYGRELPLLKSVEILPGGSVDFYYNYFEDDSWENAGFDANEADVWSNKIGGQEFCSVVVAAYMLLELYDENPGLVTVNGDIIDPETYVGWINHLCGTQFSLEKRSRLWELAELFALSRVDEYDEPLSFSELKSIIPYALLPYTGGTEFSDLCYITQGTETLREDQVQSETYPADVLRCKRCLEEYFQEVTEEDAVENLWQLLQVDRAQRQKCEDPLLREIAKLTLFLPARVFVYLASELKEQEFWGNWKALYESVYHDEVQKEYATPSILEVRKNEISKPVPGVRTSDFLVEDSWFTFYDTPDELKDKPKYIVSDDDRLFWWDGTDEVVISERADKWLRELAKRYEELLTEGQNFQDGDDADAALKEFLSLLIEIEEYYKRVFPFQKMFYEFVANGNKKEYKAAISLMREVYERYKEEGAAIKHMNGSWEMNSRKVTFNPGRIQMKRFMSVLANRKLRKEYFNF